MDQEAYKRDGVARAARNLAYRNECADRLYLASLDARRTAERLHAATQEHDLVGVRRYTRDLAHLARMVDFELDVLAQIDDVMSTSAKAGE